KLRHSSADQRAASHICSPGRYIANNLFIAHNPAQPETRSNCLAECAYLKHNASLIKAINGWHYFSVEAQFVISTVFDNEKAIFMCVINHSFTFFEAHRGAHRIMKIRDSIEKLWHILFFCQCLKLL